MIPVLIDGASLPTKGQLPNEIGKLADEVIKEASLLAFYQEEVDQEQSDREIIFSNNRIFDCNDTFNISKAYCRPGLMAN